MYIFTGLLTLLEVYFAGFWGTTYIHSTKQQLDEDSLQTRMSKLIKRYNGKKCHPYKAHIVSLKSKELLKYINFVCPIDEKVERLRVYNEILLCAAKSLYQRFDPEVIYCFNNEIHLVFFYNDAGSFVYDGDIMKTITSIVSHVTSSFVKELLAKSLKIDVHFTGTFIEFDQDYEALNYIIWRQLDCTRNNVTLMYKCVSNLDVESIHNVTIDEMKPVIEDKFGEIPEFIHNGNVLKKALVYKNMKIPDKYSIFRRIGDDLTQEEDFMTQEGLVNRKEFRVEHERLSENFKESFQKYVINKLL